MSVYSAGLLLCFGLCFGELVIDRDESDPFLLLLLLSVFVSLTSWFGAGAMIAQGLKRGYFGKKE